MSIFSAIRNLLVGRQMTSRRTTLSLPAPSVRFDDFPPFNLHVAELMRFDPQVRVALGARNGLLMSAEVEVSGPRDDVNHWVREQWDRVWCECAHQLVRAKLYGFQPFEVFFRQSSASGGRQPPDSPAPSAVRPLAEPTRGAGAPDYFEISELRDRPVAQTRLLVRDDRPVGFVWKDGFP